MDIRGIEVTNQLRSAIRAKLLELGVRYDEELPDYILVMVVNKKTRQQMHEDLHLFLEDSTSPFVEWLHNQVLKKLQKVTIAKKKANREFVPTVIVKQEEERKKRKSIADSENYHAPLIDLNISPIVTKEEKQQKNIEKTTLIKTSPVIDITTSTSGKSDKNSCIKSNSPSLEAIKSTTNVPATQNSSEIASEEKYVDCRVRITTKRPIESEDDAEAPEKRINAVSIEPDNLDKKETEGEEEKITKDEKRLKSCINKPKITSVVSVKNRLGIVSPRKNFGSHRGRDGDNRYRQSERRFEKTNFGSNRFERNACESNRIDKNDCVDPVIRRSNFQRVKCFEVEKVASRNRICRTLMVNEARNRSAKNFNDKVSSSRIKTAEKQTSTVKNRLGVNRNVGGLKKSIGQNSSTHTLTTTIKNRLGPLRNHVSVTDSYVGFVPVKNIPKTGVEGNTSNVEAEDDPDDCQSVINVGPVKSHVIALKRPEIIDGRSSKMGANVANLEQEEDVVNGGSKSIASKVIVTPRPLKPLKPAQKRATQSLLLRAVAEANQSVVKQKNPEPVLSDKKPKLKPPKPPGTREIGKNLSVHLNATKRLVMEKIQVQLRTTDAEGNDKSKQYAPHPVNDEHIGVVMSLFQRSNDNQKFLVTLNGYNNNVIKGKTLSDEEDERLEMEVTEEDEIVLSNVRNDLFEQKELSPTKAPQIIQAEETQDCYKVGSHENNENHNSENVETVEEVPHRKRRRLSPIIYTRSSSPHQSEYTTMTTLTPILSGGGKERVEQKSITEVSLSTVVDKSKEQCRYWPNCTLGTKCVYHHPAVPCGAFPACKFGEKCAYKHPKCKFGVSCTKLGCVFSHPKQQCKYHPFCIKPTCSYSHPPVHLPVVPTETIRAKFTWKRQD